MFENRPQSRHGDMSRMLFSADEREFGDVFTRKMPDEQDFGQYGGGQDMDGYAPPKKSSDPYAGLFQYSQTLPGNYHDSGAERFPDERQSIGSRNDGPRGANMGVPSSAAESVGDLTPRSAVARIMAKSKTRGPVTGAGLYKPQDQGRGMMGGGMGGDMGGGMGGDMGGSRSGFNEVTPRSMEWMGQRAAKNAYVPPQQQQQQQQQQPYQQQQDRWGGGDMPAYPPRQKNRMDNLFDRSTDPMPQAQGYGQGTQMGGQGYEQLKNADMFWGRNDSSPPKLHEPALNHPDPIAQRDGYGRAEPPRQAPAPAPAPAAQEQGRAWGGGLQLAPVKRSEPPAQDSGPLTPRSQVAKILNAKKSSQQPVAPKPAADDSGLLTPRSQVAKILAAKQGAAVGRGPVKSTVDRHMESQYDPPLSARRGGGAGPMHKPVEELLLMQNLQKSLFQRDTMQVQPPVQPASVVGEEEPPLTETAKKARLLKIDLFERETAEVDLRLARGEQPKLPVQQQELRPEEEVRLAFFTQQAPVHHQEAMETEMSVGGYRAMVHSPPPEEVPFRPVSNSPPPPPEIEVPDSVRALASLASGYKQQSLGGVKKPSPVRAAAPAPPAKEEPKQTHIKIKGLKPAFTEQALRDSLRDLSVQLQRCKVVLNPKNGKCKGEAFLSVAGEGDMKSFMQELSNRTLAKVTLCTAEQVAAAMSK